MTQKNEYMWLEDGEEPDAADRMASGLLTDPGLPIRYYSKDWKRRYVELLREDLQSKGEKGLKGQQGQDESDDSDYEFLRDPESWNRSRKV